MGLQRGVSKKRFDRVSTVNQIPLAGGPVTIPVNALSSDVADWIDERDKIPILLCCTLSLPSPVAEKQGFMHQPELKTTRIGVWINFETKQVVVGCRATGVFKVGFQQDVSDDAVIAGLRTKAQCDLQIVQEATPIVQALIENGFTDIVAAGHSLGGSAAMCLAQKFPQLRAVSLFGGSSPLNVKTEGPGPGRATHYHVQGDLVSSHVAPSAAKVVRVVKIGYEDSWGTVYPHLSSRVLKSDGAWKIITPNEEQESWLRYGKTGGVLQALRSKIVAGSPIPGSNGKSKSMISTITEGVVDTVLDKFQLV